LRSLAERAGGAKNDAGFSKQLLAITSQHQAAANAIEQRKAEFFLKFLNLAR
jgi:hypothetical protein